MAGTYTGIDMVGSTAATVRCESVCASAVPFTYLRCELARRLLSSVLLMLLGFVLTG